MNNVSNDLNLQKKIQEPVPIDAKAIVQIEGGGSQARVKMIPPKDGGKDATEETIYEALKVYGVTYGFDSEAIKALVRSKRYNEFFVVAKAKPPVRGEDGRVEYLFDTVVKYKPSVDIKDFVDYRDLGIIRNITKGTVIANIIYQTKGTPGISVLNKPIPALQGNAPKVEFAENIGFSDDKKTLIALEDGNLVFLNDKFAVQTEFHLTGNVDVSTGNIDFIGNIFIKGDVKEGFTVRSSKNVYIGGAVSGATIHADGDIRIKDGVIGSKIIACGNVELGFAENSKIECSKYLKCKSLYLCDTNCNGTVSVCTGHGSVIGGRVIATKGLVVNNLGSKSYIPTNIIIGDNAILLEEKNHILEEINKIDAEEQKCILIIKFLKEKQAANNVLPPDKLNAMEACAKTVIILRDQKNSMQNRIDEIDNYLKIKQDLSVKCNMTINPGVRITINDCVLNINQSYYNSIVKIENGEMVICKV